MSNNPNDPDDSESKDRLDSERLPDVQQAKAVKNAQRRRAESFTSFSEGTQAIDKFKILGATGEHPVVKPPSPLNEETSGVRTRSEDGTAHVSGVNDGLGKKRDPIRSAPSSHPAQTATVGTVPPSPPAQTSVPSSPKPSVALGSSSNANADREPSSQQGFQADLQPQRSIMRRPPKDDSFTSFSDGLPAVDKFGILDPDADKVLPVFEFLSQSSCRFLSPFGETTGATSSEPRKSTNIQGGNTVESRTLNRLMFLFDTVPWGDTVNVEVCAKPQFIEYSFDEHTMMLDKSSNDEHTILNFAHQAYHSTNRLLTKLYDGEKMDREGFIDLYIWSEVAALVTELNVRKELGITKVTPPKVLCQESSGSVYSVNVEELLKTRGMKTLHDVLFHSMVRGTEDLALVYVFDKLFDIYDQTYDSELPIARQYTELCISSGIERDCV